MTPQHSPNPTLSNAKCGLRDWAFDSDLLNSMNFGGYSRGTRQGYLRFSANSFSSMLIQVDLSTVLESS